MGSFPLDETNVCMNVGMNIPMMNVVEQSEEYRGVKHILYGSSK